jgi:tetratricopeptide (TPR) repeat protein
MSRLFSFRFSTVMWAAVGLLAAVNLLSLPSCGSAAQTASTARPDPAAVEIASGIRLLQGKEPAAAKLHFSAGIRANPRSADALTWRGIAENQLKQYTEAVRDFESALHIEPDELPAHYNLALSLIRLEQADRAIEQLRIVVKAQPGVLEPEYNLAVLLEEKHDTVEAIEHLQIAYRAQQNDMGVIQHLLVDLLVAGRAEEAQPILERVRAEAPAEAKQQVGIALLEAGQFRQAVLLLESVRAQAQPNRESGLLLARAYIGAQEDSKAIDILKPTEAADGTGETAYLLGMAYSDTGASEDARSAFESAIKANPRNGRALYHLGLLESVTPEQSSAALRHLREAMRLEPGNAAYGIALGKILLQRDNAQEAMTLLERVHAEAPESAERDLLLGIAQITVSGPGQAVPVLLRAVAENPSLALPYNMLGFCYFVQGDLAKAADYYRQASELNPETRIFAHGAAVAFERSNNTDQAMIYAARAVALPGANGDDHYLLGKLLGKAGRTEDAIRELNEAITLNPDLEAPYYLLARTCSQMGETEKATEWIARLKELKQKHEHSYAETIRNAQSVKSSALLQGAQIAGPDAQAP